MADIPIQVAGDDTFVLGMDGYTSASKLGPGEYVEGFNIINRGGIAMTRPGSRVLFDMPAGNVQGITLFKPSNGVPNLVFCVDGKVYASTSPFRTYTQLANIQFSKYSKYIAWSTTIQSTYYDAGGALKNLDIPISVLMMQDGVTRAAYWDGTNNAHIDPTPSNSEFTVDGKDGTPVGLWMIWSNNRLWVSRKSQIFASDIGNPLKFTESQYLNEARSFYLPGPCTGIIETTDRQGIICFTPDVGVFLETSIQDRTKWAVTPNFQQTTLPNIGCIAPRSLVQQYGLLWWYTPRGLVNQNSALQLNITSRMDIQDNEMIKLKQNLSYDLTGVCGSYLENFLFQALPSGHKINTHLHVLDQAAFEQNANSWPGYWTGWRPIEFARGIIDSQERVFLASLDGDGINRAWEICLPDKTDNGVPITSYVKTRQHLFENRDYKKFRYAEIEMVEIKGPTAIMSAAAGFKGTFQTILRKDIDSVIGQIYSDQEYGTDAALLSGSRSQTRIVLSQDGSDPSDCNASCIESDRRGLNDKMFSLLISWSGIAGISAYRLFAQGEPVAYQGFCEVDETGENRLVSGDGCGITGLFNTEPSLTIYSSTQTFTGTNPHTGQTATNTQTAFSSINQQDADRKALKTAQWYVFRAIGEII